ncbi:PREDICTED: uncharacterized protein LOC107350852 [Acropora digitifera]|uniref:uncharacterized protein LOC107350852 n=1 Tax=Acropora digitifera TaxID=70779 RepID=UPI000779F962|nr:PREDICTED: uncharacterized protein LOC107350852 [Acropora digitifera]
MNVFLGIRLSGANLDDTPLYIMIVYAVGVAGVIVFSEYVILKNGERVTYVAASKDVEGDHMHVVLKGADNQSIASRMLLFGFLVVLVFSAVVALVVLIAIAGNGRSPGSR